MFACKTTRARGFRFLSVAALAATCCGMTTAASPVDKPRTAGKRAAAASPWEKATQDREALESIPEADRTRADYSRALDGFRTIYHDNPGSIYAAPAISAVAELLAEQGRTQHDPKSLKAAIGQYEFLRTQYPG